MSDQQLFTIRAKQIGVLLHQARLKAGKSMKEVGRLLGVSSSMVKAYENGEKAPSLSELEAFAYIYGVPIEYFWEEQPLGEGSEKAEDLKWDLIIQLRNRIIGAKICQARMDQGKTLKELSQVIQVSPRVLRSIELGDRPVSMPELEKLLDALNLTVRDLFVKEGVVGEWFMRQKAIKNFEALPVELQEFVTRPINRPYLELAKKFSEMDVNKLREVAEVLLEITF